MLNTAEGNVATTPRAFNEPGEFQEPSPDLASVAVIGTRSELRRVYHLSREQAAEELHISLAQLKRTCQQLGVVRWPYRKLDSLCQLRSHLEKHPRRHATLQLAHLRAIDLELQCVYNDPNHEVSPDLLALRRHCWKQAQRIKKRASCSSLPSASTLQAPATPSGQQSPGSRQRPTSLTPGAHAERLRDDDSSGSGSLHCPGDYQLGPARTAGFSAATGRGQGGMGETDAGLVDWSAANVKSEVLDWCSGHAQEQACVMHDAVEPCRTSFKRSSLDHLLAPHHSRTELRNHTSLKRHELVANEVRRQLMPAFQGFHPRNDASKWQGAGLELLPSVTSLLAPHAGVAQCSECDIDGASCGSAQGRGSISGASMAPMPARLKSQPSLLAGVHSLGAEVGVQHSLPAASACASPVLVTDVPLPSYRHCSVVTGWEGDKHWNSSYPPSPALPTFGSLPSPTGHFSAAGPSTPVQQRPSLLAAPLAHASMPSTYPTDSTLGSHSLCEEDVLLQSPAAGSCCLEPNRGDPLRVGGSGLPSTQGSTSAASPCVRLPGANPSGGLLPLALQPLAWPPAARPPPASPLGAHSSHLAPTPGLDINSGGVGSVWAGYHSLNFMLQLPDDIMEDVDCMAMDMYGGVGALGVSAGGVSGEGQDALPWWSVSLELQEDLQAMLRAEGQLPC